MTVLIKPGQPYRTTLREVVPVCVIISGVSRYTLPIKCSGMKLAAWCEVLLEHHCSLASH